MAQFDVIAWMTARGRTGYANEINALRCTRDEIEAEAGRYGAFCQFTQAALAKIDAEIEEVIRSAQDRYDDWASD